MDILNKNIPHCRLCVEIYVTSETVGVARYTVDTRQPIEGKLISFVDALRDRVLQENPELRLKFNDTQTTTQSISRLERVDRRSAQTCFLADSYRAFDAIVNKLFDSQDTINVLTDIHGRHLTATTLPLLTLSKNDEIPSHSYGDLEVRCNARCSVSGLQIPREYWGLRNWLKRWKPELLR